MLQRLCENCCKPTGRDFYFVKDASNIWLDLNEMPEQAVCIDCYGDGGEWFGGRAQHEEIEDLTTLQQEVMRQFPETAGAAARPTIARRVRLRHSDAPLDILAETEADYDELLTDLLKRTFAAEVEETIELPLRDNSAPGVYWVVTGASIDEFRPDSIPVSPYGRNAQSLGLRK